MRLPVGRSAPIRIPQASGADMGKCRKTKPAQPLLRAMVDALPIGACVIGPDLTVHAWNSVLATWTGVSPQYAICLNLSDLCPPLRSPNDAQRLSSMFAQGTQAVFHKASGEIPIPMRADGIAAACAMRVVRLPGRPRRALLTVERQVVD